jgi:hypothetical protein
LSDGGKVVIGVVIDKAKKRQSSLVSIIDRIVAVFAKWPFWNDLAADRLREKAGPFGGSERQEAVRQETSAGEHEA